MADDIPGTATETAPASGAVTLLGGQAAPTAAPATTAPAQSYVNADGSFAPGWLDSLPPELKGNPALTTVPTLADLAKSYVHTKGMVGKKLQAPSETSTPEEVANWRKTVGAPDTPEGYGELRPEDFPADQWDGETAGELAKIAHKHHIPPAALKEIIGLHTSAVKAGVAKLEAGEGASMQAELATLKQAWGADFETNAHGAKTFARALGLDPDTNPIFRSAEVAQAMARGAKLIMGDRAIAASAPGIHGGIESRFQDIQRSPEYLGERGPQAQTLAQSQLHSLYAARETK